MNMKNHGLLVTMLTFLIALPGLVSASDFRLTAFEGALGFSELTKGEAKIAHDMLSARSLTRSDYSELNNLCVSEIILEDFASAIEACELALNEKNKSRDLGFNQKKKITASILSNLAVAKALGGDLVGAQLDLETSLSLNRKNKSAISNFAWLNSDLLASL